MEDGKIEVLSHFARYPWQGSSEGGYHMRQLGLHVFLSNPRLKTPDSQTSVAESGGKPFTSPAKAFMVSRTSNPVTQDLFQATSEAWKIRRCR